MIVKKLFSVSAVLLVAVMGSCNKSQDTNLTSGITPVKRASTSRSSGTLAGVNLGVAGNFAILSKTGITDVYQSAVTGDIGTSPIIGAAILLNCLSA